MSSELGPPPPTCGSVDVRQVGRLRLCTRGFFFEPDDHRLPIYKFPFRATPGAPVVKAGLALPSGLAAALAASEPLDDAKVIVVQPTSVLEMKANNVIEPYRTVSLPDLAPREAAAPQSPPTAGRSFRGAPKPAAVAAKPAARPIVEGAASHVGGRTTVLFALQHALASGVAPLAQQLWRIQQQSAAGAHSSAEAAALAPILDQRRDGPFDTALVSSYRERALLPAGPVATYAERVFPLVSCPGRIMVTDAAVYLMPVAINAVAGRCDGVGGGRGRRARGSFPPHPPAPPCSDACSKWPLKDIRRVLRRRRLLRETGLELVLTDTAAAFSAASAAAEAAGLSRTGGVASGGVFLAFSSPALRDTVYRCILKARSPAPPDPLLRDPATSRTRARRRCETASGSGKVLRGAAARDQALTLTQSSAIRRPLLSMR